MILTCPQCATRYRVEAHALSPEGRKVRCARCGCIWIETLPAMQSASAAGATETLALSPPAIPPAQRDVEAKKPASAREVASRFGRPLVSTWPVFLLVVAAILWSTAHRDRVSRDAALQGGAAQGLILTNVRYTRDFQNGRALLIVDGRVENSTSRALPMPEIEAVLADANGRKLDSWLFRAGAPELAPGQETLFQTRRLDPPPAARNLKLKILASPIAH